MLLLRTWVSSAVVKQAAQIAIPAAQYSPTGQAGATARAHAVVVEATTAISATSAVPLRLFAAGLAGPNSWASQILLDFCLCTWPPPLGIALTGESEMYAVHDVSIKGNYAWDFIKLMIVPSPARLFLCRVGGTGGQPGPQRRQILRDLLGNLARAYDANGLLRQGDELGLVILPAEKWSANTQPELWVYERRLLSPWRAV